MKPSTERSVLPRHDQRFGALTTFGVGGAARLMSCPSGIDELAAALKYAEEHSCPVWIMGDGSNTVVADAGFDGLVIRPQFKKLEFTSVSDELNHSEYKPPGRVYSGAGVPWDQLVESAVERGLAGIECLSGIPGSVGAAPVQNIGAYGQQLSEVLDFVDAFDRRSGTITRIAAEDCSFGYRTSRFKTDDAERFVITGVQLSLRPDGIPTLTYRDLKARFPGCKPPGLSETRTAVLEIRRNKSMVFDQDDPESRGAGSFFVNPIVRSDVRDAVLSRIGEHDDVPIWDMGNGLHKLAAAWLIEHAGIHKGFRLGHARISSKHTLALVADERCSASDVVALARHVRDRVRDHWGIELHAEPRFVGFDQHPLHPGAGTTS